MKCFRVFVLAITAAMTSVVLADDTFEEKPSPAKDEIVENPLPTSHDELVDKPAVENERCCNVPTLWKIRNMTSEKLYVQCIAYVEGLGGNPIRFSVESNVREFTHNWGRSWDNDGMGLNWANWQCAASLTPNPLSQEGILKSLVHTDWGENITMVIARHVNQFKVSRL